MNRCVFPALLIATVGLAGCGGDETTATAPAVTSPAMVPATSSPPAASAASATPAPTVVEEEPAPATVTTPQQPPDATGFDDDFDICASVPPLDVINVQLTEPATQLVELERGPGLAICEAAGGDVDNVQFQRMTDVTRELSIELANELGATVTDLSDPPGGFAYSGAAAVVIDGVEWTVQTITWDTIGDPDSPAAIERSATLLRAWLALMGITP